jgi:O-antigen/teichoic acid export membrane protein
VRAIAAAGAALRWFRAGPAGEPATPGTFASTAAPLLGFAGPTLLATGIVLAAQTLLRVLLVRWSTLDAAGQYQAADSIAQGLSLIPGAASIAFMRSVASGEGSGYPGLAASLKRGLERISGYNLPLCLLLMGVVPWATVALFGHEFSRARPVLVLLATAYGLLGPCAVFGAALLGRGEVWTGALLNLMWAAVVLGVYGFALARFGAVGAALAVVAGYLVLLIVCLVVLAPRWSVPVRSLAPSVLVTIATLAVGCLLALSPGIPAVVTALVCLALGLAVMARWGLPSLAAAVRPGEGLR